MGKRVFTTEEAQSIGEKIGVDFARIRIEEFRNGLSIELEHGARDPQTDVTHDDLVITGKIAFAHLKEIGDYYTRLQALEDQAAAEKKA